MPSSAGPLHWVALLRGVNVGGITVRSAELGALFHRLGFDAVRTVLATGNVVFTASGDQAQLKRRIESALEDEFGYDAWIVLLPFERLDGIIDAFPYEERDDRQPYVVFCSSDETLDELSDEAADSAGEHVTRGGGVLYWEVPVGSSTSTPFATLLAKSRYKPFTTTRNLRTLRKLL
ncbi:DUF1697 domain-containing protein [Paramicrobacterium fandaimingii]|uniref:DUF1697 domain-containing protein n=1 Tax=Paramicrobacterium fandaimingii TaxID=2708079 RepID=UPI00141E671E|nr:DUF1697 domain-containing protein [Microbacterium fandaimingii]